MDSERSLVVLRHGQSIWNVQQRFTGSTNVPLTELGRQEARRAGRLLRDHSYGFDVVYTSALERAQHTAELALQELGTPDVETIIRPVLNERCFGIMEGMKFTEAAQQYGPEWGQPWLWGLRPEGGESLEDLVERVRSFCEDEVIEALGEGQRVLVVAHGNTIRAIDYVLGGGSAQALERVPTATPLIYTWNGSRRPVRTALAP
ncbi:MAG: 2,3-bisphosphoglycerate-dependent phosphoglycerate mutase [Bryobacterales bacterium]|nr:2,3-bisphosphoglycerate-dependent phosphoglycerate mutase [Bryobacterales bacterium]